MARVLSPTPLPEPAPATEAALAPIATVAPALRVDAASPADLGGPALATLIPATTASGRPDVAGMAGTLAVPFAWLGGTSRAERWYCTDPRQIDLIAGGPKTFEGDGLQFGHWTMPMPTADVEAVTEAAYRKILDISVRRGYPHLLRVWNFFGEINAGPGDLECYRRFCVGRARAVPTEPATGYAAATAIGIPGAVSELHVSWLASTHPGVPIENPRQVSAWEYPRDYGPASPGFSRAMLLDWNDPPLLLVSGTASVIGHESRHHGCLAQLDEALVNLDHVIARAAARLGSVATAGAGTVLRVYLRNPADAAAVGARLLERFGARMPFMLLHGDICRRELLVELEAVQRF